MRNYTIYKDANGKLFAVWDDMIANGDYPMTGTRPFTAVKRGAAQGIRELTSIQHRLRNSSPV